MSNERIRRPKLERTKPIRNSATLFRPPGTPQAKDGADDTVGVAHGAPRQSPDDVVSRSVDLGYRVIDDYVHRGQQAAERLRRGTYGPDALAEDVQDIATRMIQYVSDFSATWLEFLERTTGSGRGAVEQPAPREKQPYDLPEADAPHPRKSVSTSAPVRVRVELETSRRAEIALDLEPVSSIGRFIAHALRSTDPNQPRIEDVSFQADGTDRATFRVRVSDDHPAGIYSGRIVDEETNLPVGSLTVSLEPRDPEDR